MTGPLVSTIIPVFNRPAMLREAVASVLDQTYGPVEVIIVDDSSTDHTPLVIAELGARHPEVRSIRVTNGGPGLAREAGRGIARGEFIQYLDSDDLLLPRKFEFQIHAFENQPECGVAYGITRYRDGEGREIACTWKEANQVQKTIFPSFLVARWWETSTPLYRTSVCDAAGPWTALRLEEDWEYDCRVGALGVRLAYVDEVVAEHRDHSDGRLSRGSGADPARLRDRAAAHELIASHARRAGVPNDAPEFQRFARELFHLARQCGASGLSGEAKRLLTLARAISPSADMRIYQVAARVVGWRNAGRAASWIERR
ncbi:MAG: glycosyltransferase family 2 protein [Acidobacteria bacterium]|nr:glycosyltransferase family 2 protein [Acidobacteriota bacterium]MBV9071320.1 glycosyltransferase family 2 protein [Acidobacteriota bacterium]MBV9188158.1 glycosyltransferase family 2 protein [Acidobacteriota bacterium]